MRVKIQVVVSSDDNAVSQTASSELQLATGLHGVDPSSAKQDFLAQADTLVRAISETQLPALYQAVEDGYREKQAAKDAERPSEEHAKVKAKLNKLRNKKQQTSEPDAPEAEEPVQCTTCGATVPHDEAHFVSIVQDGKYARDGILCEACYQGEMRALQKRQEEVQQ